MRHVRSPAQSSHLQINASSPSHICSPLRRLPCVRTGDTTRHRAPDTRYRAYYLAGDEPRLHPGVAARAPAYLPSRRLDRTRRGTRPRFTRASLHGAGRRRSEAEPGADRVARAVREQHHVGPPHPQIDDAAAPAVLGRPPCPSPVGERPTAQSSKVA